MGDIIQRSCRSLNVFKLSAMILPSYSFCQKRACSGQNAKAKYDQTCQHLIKSKTCAGLRFKPSAASMMCSDMSFSVSLFYPDNFISSSTLRKALSALVEEVPILAGRMTRSNEKIYPRFADCAIMFKQEYDGFPFRSTTVKDLSVKQAVNKIWDSKQAVTLYDTINRCHTLEPLSSMKKTGELASIDLVRCTDGSILTLHISHVLADAGRAFKLLERISKIYTSFQTGGRWASQELTCDTWFERNLDSGTTCWENGMNRTSTLLGLKPSDIMSLPKLMKQYSTKYVPLYFYVPRTSVEVVQKFINSRFNDQNHPSKLDIVQAINITLISAVRHNRMIPAPGENVVINVDLSKISNPSNISDILGNSSDFLEIKGTSFQSVSMATTKKLDDVFEAITTNALSIRNHLKQLHSHSALNVAKKLQKQHDMSMLPKHLVLAAFIVHGNREKLASCSAVASFPTDKVCMPYHTFTENKHPIHRL